MLVIDLYFNAVANGHHGFCGIAVRGERRVFHAVTPETILDRVGDSRTTMDAPCGKQVRIFQGDTEFTAFMWPPRVSMLPDGWTRCAECHDLTGRKRPAKEWAA